MLASAAHNVRQEYQRAQIGPYIQELLVKEKVSLCLSQGEDGFFDF